jgi:hypothetical protein
VKIIVTFAALALISAALAGCAYKPLKAPCSPDEGGTPLAYVTPPAVPEAFRRLDHCGPMRPI